MKNLCYLTYQDDPADSDPDHDEPILIAALQQSGYAVSSVDWRRSFDLSNFDAVLIRSTWDYTKHFNEFIDWFGNATKRVRFINPPEVILANINKNYLFDMSANGYPIVPSKIVSSTADLDLFDELSSKLVFKPTVGAGARGAFVSNSQSEALAKTQAHFQTSDISLLMQPYLEEVDTDGEIAVVCCNGEPLHAVVKRPALSSGGHGDFQLGIELDSKLVHFVRQVQDFSIAGHAVSDLWYSRVDLVPTKSGYLLMELELFEPTLFLKQNPSSARTFADNLKLHLA